MSWQNDPVVGGGSAAATTAPVPAAGGWQNDPVIAPTSAPLTDAQQSQAADAAAAKHLARQRRVTPAPDTSAPTTLGDVFKVANQGAAGFNKSFGDLLFLPADAFDEGVDALSRGVQSAIGVPYVAPGPSAHDLFNRIAVEPAGAPTTEAQNVAGAGGSMAGANILPLAGMSTLAGKGIRYGVPLARQAAGTIGDKLRGAADAVLDWMAQHPTQAAVGDTAGAFESGVGGETARSQAEQGGYGPEGQITAEHVGQILAPFAVSGVSRFGPTALTTKGTVLAAKAGAQALPQEATDFLGLSPSGSVADRLRERLAYGNREGKYADPTVPPPAEPNWLTRQQDAGAQRRQDNAIRNAGGEIQKVLAQPGVPERLAEAEDLQKTIPGFNPGVAKASGDPALLNLQRKIEGEATGDELRQAQSRADNSAKSIRDYLIAQAPEVPPKVNPDFTVTNPPDEPPQDTVANILAARFKDIHQRIAQQQSDVQSGIDQRTAALQRQSAQQAADAQARIRATSDTLPETDPTQVGNYLRETRTSLKQTADDKVTALRNAIDPEGTSQVRVGTDTDGQPVYAKVDQVLRARTAMLQERRDIASASAKSPADMARARQLDGQITKMNGFVDNLRLPDPDMQQRFDAFRSYYRDEYAPKFLEGASRDVGRYDQFGYGKNRVDSEDVPGAFFKPNNISEARQFNTLYGDNPQARQQMTDYALDDLRRNAVDPNTGMIKEGAVNKWLAKNERVLNEMPWVRDAVAGKNPDADYAAAADAQQRGKLAANPKTAGQLDPDIQRLQERFGQLEQRQRAVADTKLSGLLGDTPEKQIAAGLNDWQIMRSLKRSVAADPQADAALTRAVWDHVVKAYGEDTLGNPDKLQSWIDGHRRPIAQVLSPEHLASLETVIKAARIEGQLPRPTGKTAQIGTLADKAAGQTGLSVQGFLSRALNVMKGYVSKEYALSDIGLRIWHNTSGQAVRAAWKEALNNPKVAESLAMIVKTKSAPPMQLRRLQNHLVTVGAVDANGDQTQ